MNYDNDAYAFYLLNGAKTQILSGWQYREDAVEAKEDTPGAGRIYSRRFASRLLDPTVNANWEAPKASPPAPTPTRWRVVQYKKHSGRGGFPSCELRWAIERDGQEEVNQSGNVRSWAQRTSAVRAMKKLQAAEA